MKNRNTPFKPSAGLLIPLLLACLAAVFISAPNPALARDQVPFNGTLAGCVETQEPVDECTIDAHAVLFGNATPSPGPENSTKTSVRTLQILPTLAAFTCLRPTVTNSSALSRVT
jgi:hypothetical protein